MNQIREVGARELELAKALEKSVHSNVAQLLSKASKIKAKTDSAIQCTDALYKYYDQKAKVYLAFKAQLAQLPSQIHPGELGTTEAGLDFLSRIASSELEQYSMLATDIQQNTLKSLQDLHNELQPFATKCGTFVQELKDFNLERFHKALATWTDASNSPANQTQDPFLLQTTYYTAALGLSQSLVSWRIQLNQLFQDFVTKEKYRIDVTKSIVKGSVFGFKSAMTKVTKEAEVALTVVDSISSTSDCDAFVRQSDLLSTTTISFSDTLNPDPDMTMYANILKSPFVVRFGEIELSGLISWTKALFVLTSFGWIHYFSSKGTKNNNSVMVDLLKPDESIELKFCKIAIGEAKQGCFQLNVTPTGFFSRSKTYSLRCPSQEDMNDWILQLQKYCSGSAISLAPLPTNPT